MGSSSGTQISLAVERRRHVRLPVSTVVTFTAGNRTLEGVIVNMSMSGAYVAMPATSDLRVGDTATIEFAISGAQSPMTTRIPGVIRRCVPGEGVGVRFSISEMRVDTFVFIKTILTMHCTSPEQRQRIIEEYYGILTREELRIWANDEGGQ